MKRHVHCAEQEVSPSNVTKYCSCHEKWHSKISERVFENRWNFSCNAGTIPRPFREWSERETVSPQPASQPRLLFQLAANMFYFKIQQFPPRLSFTNSTSAAPATKSDTWISPSAAPATKTDTWTTPSAALATKSHTWPSHQVLHLPRKVTPERHQVLHLPRKLTLELHQVLRLPRKVTLDLHQVLHLPRKVELHQAPYLPRQMTRLLNPRHIWNVIYNAARYW